jgi:methyltransferase (TIGR00027 family)
MRAAKSRAKHQLLDIPLIFEDPLSLQILGGERDDLGTKSTPDGILARGFRAALVARSRIAEDELHEAVKRGVRQYVVLGAGLDTFAYRNPYPATVLQVFEVDHPATQRWKRRLLAHSSIQIPSTLRFVEVDFETQSLRDRLHLAGFNFATPTQFSWLGVTMYLTPAAILQTLRMIASNVPDAGIVFDYVPGYSSRNILGKLFLRILTRRFAKLEEPWTGLLDPAMLTAELEAMGFSHVNDISVEALNDRFFKGRRDKLKFNEHGLRFTRLGHVMVVRK